MTRIGDAIVGVEERQKRALEAMIERMSAIERRVQTEEVCSIRHFSAQMSSFPASCLNDIESNNFKH